MLIGAAGQFSINSAIPIKSDEACAIMCLKQVENKCKSFKVDLEEVLLMCKLRTIGYIGPSEEELDRIFVECKFPIIVTS